MLQNWYMIIRINIDRSVCQEPHRQLFYAKIGFPVGSRRRSACIMIHPGFNPCRDSKILLLLMMLMMLQFIGSWGRLERHHSRSRKHLFFSVFSCSVSAARDIKHASGPHQVPEFSSNSSSSLYLLAS